MAMKMPKVSVSDWTGEEPTGPKRGRDRAANPFDDLVKESYDNKQAKFVEVAHEKLNDRNEELGAVVKMLRNAAAYHDVGLNVKIATPAGAKTEGIFFKAVEKRQRKSKLPNEDQSKED